MKKLFSTALALCNIIAFAQQDGRVGINTETPAATLNVKSKTGTTSSTTNLQLQNANNSVLMKVLDNGNVGIGTSTPQTKLDIVGKVKITDGTQQAGRVLTSDADGIASWETISMGNKIAQVRLLASDYTIESGKKRGMSSTDMPEVVYTSFDKFIDEIGITVNNEGFTLPKGKYIFYQSHDVNNSEYCMIGAVTKSDNRNIYMNYYTEWFNGSYMVNLPQNDSIRFKLYCFTDTPNNDFYNKKEQYDNGSISNTVTILKLN